jgi:hypothetical protein
MSTFYCILLLQFFKESWAMVMLENRVHEHFDDDI